MRRRRVAEPAGERIPASFLTAVEKYRCQSETPATTTPLPRWGSSEARWEMRR